MSDETSSKTGRFLGGAVVGAVVGALVAGLIVVSLGDAQRIYVTEKIDGTQEVELAVGAVVDERVTANTVALDAESEAIGSLLLDRGALTAEQLDAAEDLAEDWNVSLVKVLLSRRWLTTPGLCAFRIVTPPAATSPERTPSSRASR